MGFLDSLLDFNFDGEADFMERSVGFAVAATMFEMEEERKQQEAELWKSLNDNKKDGEY